MCEHLERVETLLSIPNYDLIFIGRIGVGKTTAICRLFDLTLEEEKPIGRTGKTLIKSTELLSTGAGRTTIGEVVIQPSDTSDCYFEIESYPDEQIEEFIIETCTYFWHKAHSTSADVAPEIPAAELLRAIRNLTDLREAKVEGRACDTAIELAKQHSNLDDFIDAVFDRAGLEDRTQAKLLPPQPFGTLQEEKRWLKTAFANLNLGKTPGFSLPKRITVHLSDRILNFDRYPKFRSIIDTRGMDNLHDRADLAGYIRERDNTICLLAETFTSAPTNVLELLNQHLTPESKDIDTKLAMLVLLQKGEAEDVVGLDGTVESETEGIEIRAQQITDAFARDNLKFLEQNILFLDALQHYDEQRVLKHYYTEEDVRNARIAILDNIQDIIYQREQKLLREVEGYEVMFEQIQAGGVLTQADEDYVANLKKKIAQHQTLNHRFLFVNRYLDRLRSYHASTFRAINARRGVYELSGIDIYFDAKAIVERLVRAELAGEKEQIAGAISLVEQSASEGSKLQPVMQFLQKQLDQFFENVVMQVAVEMAQVVEDYLGPEAERSEFWNTVQARWGRGPGYRDDVLHQYKTQLKDCDAVLAACVQSIWQSEFMQRLLLFFGDD